MPVTNPEDGQVPGALPTFGGQVDDSPRGIKFRALSGAGGDAAGHVFDQLSSQLGAWEDRTAQDEGQRAGKVAGLDPNYRPDDDPSLRGVAFRNAATVTYANGLEASARTALTQAYDQYNQLPADQRAPGVLAGNIQKIKADFDQNHVFPEIQGQFNTSFSALSQSFLNGAQSDIETRQRDAAKASFLTNQNSARDTGMRLAAIPSTSDGAIADMLRQHDAATDAAVNAGEYSASQAVAIKEGFKQDLLTARVRSLFDNTPDADKPGFAQKFMTKFGSLGERDLAIRTVYGEAGGETPDGQSAVAHVLANRVASGNYGKTATDVILAPSQFSLWNSGDPAGDTARKLSPDSPQYQAIGKIVDDAFAGKSKDPTGGADHYYNPNVASPAWGDQLAQKNDVTIGNHRFVGKIDGAPQPTQLASNADSARGETSGLSADTVSGLTNYMGAQLRAQTSQAQHVEKQQLSDISGNLKQIEGGFDVPDGNWAALRSQYAASPSPAVQQAFAQADAIRGMYAGFKGQSPAQIDAQIDNYAAQVAKSGGAVPEQVEALKAAQAYHDRLRNDLNSNALARASRDGVISGVQPLDMTDASRFQAGLEARLPAASQAQAFYGLDKPPILTPDEKSQLTSVAAQGGEPMVQIAAAAAHVMGPGAGRFFSEIGGSAPSFAQMGRVAAMNGDAGFLRDAAWAVNQDQSTGGKVLKPAAESLQQNAGSTYGDAFKASPDLQVGALSLAGNALAAQIAREGYDPRQIPPALMTQALQKAVGATFVGNTQYGGVADVRTGAWSSQKAMAPPDVRADQLGALYRAIGDKDLASLPAPPIGRSGAPLPADALKGAYLSSIGPGRYFVSKNDPAGPDPQYMAQEGGGRFVLDLNALAPMLRQRLPGAYK